MSACLPTGTSKRIFVRRRQDPLFKSSIDRPEQRGSFGRQLSPVLISTGLCACQVFVRVPRGKQCLDS